MIEGWRERAAKHGLLALVAILLLLVSYIFYLDWVRSHRQLTFAMLDIGQGDAFFIESPTGAQVLIDVGPPNRILGALSRVISPFDRHIDAVIITNPDQDHIGGFSELAEKYKIGKVFSPGAINGSRSYEILKKELSGKKIPEFLARKGMKINLEGGARIEILFPDRDVLYWDTNDGSVVAKLSYGETEIMLMGDSTLETERIILENYPKEILESNILKVGHHGSRTSTGPAFVSAVSPSYALISDGKDNKYGHPHRETLDTLTKSGVEILRTDTLGTIVFACARMKPCET